MSFIRFIRLIGFIGFAVKSIYSPHSGFVKLTLAHGNHFKRPEKQSISPSTPQSNEKIQKVLQAARLEL